MIRLCFEPSPGSPSIDTENDFREWLTRYLPELCHLHVGYIVTDANKMWHGSNVLWMISMENNLDVMARIERSGWMIGHYVVHAYMRVPGRNETKIDNSSFRVRG